MNLRRLFAIFIIMSSTLAFGQDFVGSSYSGGGIEILFKSTDILQYIDVNTFYNGAEGRLGITNGDTIYRYFFNGKIPIASIYRLNEPIVDAVILSSDDVMLIFTQDELVFLGANIQNNFDPRIFNISEDNFILEDASQRNIVASSFLIKNNVVYGPENLALLPTSETNNSALPWIEGIEGEGIGETLHISNNTTELQNAEYRAYALFIVNGFVSLKKPYLYDLTSRVRRLRVYYTHDGKEYSKEYTLQDTPQPQELRLPQPTAEGIYLEILSVYPGTKFKDTAIQNISLKSKLVEITPPNTP